MLWGGRRDIFLCEGSVFSWILEGKPSPAVVESYLSLVTIAGLL